MKQQTSWYQTVFPGSRGAAIATLSALGLVGAIAHSAPAQESLSNSSIQFTETTVVEFEIVDTHGYYQSTVGIVNLKTGQKTPLFVEKQGFDAPTSSVAGRDDTNTNADFKGTVEGGTIVNGAGEASNLIKYTFEAGTPYALYLDSVDPRTKQTRVSVVSTNVNAASFAGSLTAGESGNLIKWDDAGLPRPGKDSDFDDFAIIAGGFTLESCPIKPQ